jgi:hypothetical protein
MSHEPIKEYPPLDAHWVRMATFGILTGVMYGYNESDPDMPKPGDRQYHYAECVAIDALRAIDKWEAQA